MGHDGQGRDGRQFPCEEHNSAIAFFAPVEGYPAKLSDPLRRFGRRRSVIFIRASKNAVSSQMSAIAYLIAIAASHLLEHDELELGPLLLTHLQALVEL